ncbi:UNVERIFIED_CONTAM: hypothetical protein Sradi_1552200 [Sesamum radiatum]|uniref:Uncharacterized protein n=1 Tax=Sesamum radiatum TaxID=300843 RepID=A0AAW2UAZ9_SESRA
MVDNFPPLNNTLGRVNSPNSAAASWWAESTPGAGCSSSDGISASSGEILCRRSYFATSIPKRRQ